MKSIEVAPYNPEWPKLYEAESNKIKNSLGKNLLDIHHIGSTSVPGLSAKPIIDIIASVTDFSKAIPSLESIGYESRGEMFLPFREYLRKGKEVNLHLYEGPSPEIELNLCFRDYLRSHPDYCHKYQQLKEELITKKSSFEKNNSNYTGYNLGKDKFIRSILQKAGFDKIRMMYANHHHEWEILKKFRQKYFFDKVPINDPYTWTFNHNEHLHLVLYQGVEIVGYAHIQLWPKNRSAIRIIVIDEIKRNSGMGGTFLKMIEKLLKIKRYKILHTESSPGAVNFYRKHDYIEMPFNDPAGEETDPRDTAMGKTL
jgi:GrpB-like predicted nucleotidyltransferase (UPF0157 family)